MTEVDQEAFDAFWYWINERHRIYLAKERGDPWPWTEDSILQTYSFCNVFRELDTVTIAFRKMLREQFADHKDLWFLYCLARQINWPETVQEIIHDLTIEFGEFQWDPQVAYDTMRRRQATGAKLYTGAYMLRGDIQRPGLDNNKPRYTCFSVLDPVWKASLTMPGKMADDEPPFMSIEQTVGWLETFPGWGGFLAYEVATDLRHTRYLSNAADIMFWANPGPGACRGLNRVFGRTLTRPLDRDKALYEMQYLLSVSNDHLEEHVPALEMRDIEHSLCETDKYIRALKKEGRPRARYKKP